MKKIIQNKLYDTNTAKRIGSINNGKATDDLFYTEEVLYRKKTGEYFLYCAGGAGTRYAKPQKSGGSKSGEIIIPVDFETAERWTQKNLSTQVFEKEFEISKENGYCNLRVVITLEEKAKLKKFARERNITLTKAIRVLLDKI